MASTGAAPQTKMSVLLLATTIVVILLVAGTAPTAVHGSQDDGCIRRVGETTTPTPLPGSCVCYDRCARDGDHGLRDAASQTCFVDCVLRNGCVCPGAGAGGGGPLRPATLDETVTVTVPRPKVSRSREEKKAEEEVLRFVAAVEPAGTVRFDVRVNGKDLHTFEGTPEDEVGVTEAPAGYAIGGLLDAIGADGDETVVVSFVPEWGGDRVTVRDVRIVYEPKNKVKSI